MAERFDHQFRAFARAEHAAARHDWTIVEVELPPQRQFFCGI